MRVSLLICCLIGVGACAEIKITGGTDSSSGTDVSEDSNVGSDSGSSDSSGQDSDVPTQDTVGDECLTNFDCLDKIQGKTPCISAKCVSGFCVKDQKPTGTACKDVTQTLSECQATTCSESGQCVISNLPDKTVCGAGLCGKLCSAGTCIPATDADYSDGNPCTKDYCDQGIQVHNDPITDLTVVCDDGDACTSGDTCLQGKCTGSLLNCTDGIACTLDTCTSASGCAHTGNDGTCDDGNPCTSDGCDLASGCTVTGLAVGATCSDGNECTISDACGSDGSCSGQPSSACTCGTNADCVGKIDNLCIGPLECVSGFCTAIAKNAVYCDPSQNSACLVDKCDATTGKCVLKAKGEGAECDDGNACTLASSCVGGACSGTSVQACDDKNSCTNDLCLPQSGCIHEANSSACDDGNACTTGDACAKGSCGGTLKSCDDGIGCTLDSCDVKTGSCSHTGTDGGACDDGNPCTKDSCDIAKGCAYSANDSGKCEDGDPCTSNTCKGGQCAAVSICACKGDGDCDDKNPCTTDSCKDSACSYAPASGSCDSADKCQVPGSGVCNSGVCVPGDKPKDCSSLADGCHNASCNPGTGACEALPKADGALCDADKNGCTVADSCVAGVCTVGKTMDCSSESGACSVGICADDGSGAKCQKKLLESGTACDDGLFCTVGDACDANGACQSGIPQTCVQFSDACRIGKCDEAAKTCTFDAKSSEFACDDGNFCTSGDHCDGEGACVSGGQTICVNTSCGTGSCDSGLGACILANSPTASACSDGDPCTIADSCDGNGTCMPGTSVSCPGDVCNVGLCDSSTGGCGVKPLGSEIPCDDGQKCTVGDHCSGYGSCTGGTWDVSCGCNQDAQCNDGNACTVDSCDGGSATCKFVIQNGSVCEDGDVCTTYSSCNSDGACVASAFFDCSSADGICHKGQCVNKDGTATCQATSLADSTPCDDGLYCTSGESCSGGFCKGGSPTVCPSAPECFAASCSESSFGCTNAPSTKGSACNDGQSCTIGDSCDGTGICNSGIAAANFAICDDGNSSTSGDYCTSGVCSGFVLVTGAPGPMTRIVNDASSGDWWFTSASAPASSVANSSKWSISPVSIDGKGGWSIANVSTPISSGPIRALNVQIAGGSNDFLAYHVPGGKSWLTASASAFTKAASGTYLSTTEWRSVGMHTTGSTGYVLLVGASSTENAVFGRCSGGYADSTSAWSCSKTTTSGYTPVAATVSMTPYNGLCLFPPCNGTPGFVGGLQKWNGVTASQLDIVTASGANGSWSSVNAGPNLKANSSSLLGGVFMYDPSGSTPITGTSQLWTVGPSGSIAYVAQGSSALIGLSLFTASYQFTDVTVTSGHVLVWGYKTGIKGDIVPVLLTHTETANSQGSSSTWIEHDLDAPDLNSKSCASNGFSSYGMGVGQKSGTIALVGNACSGMGVDGSTSLQGVIYVRK